jgi:ubiquinone biosynthesis monooxygenase Coq7
MTMRHYNLTDKICFQLDNLLKTVFDHPLPTSRSNPTEGLAEPILTDAEKKHSAALMRINHTGEVCAQALYQGQFLTAHSAAIAEEMQRCAQEENDHLIWCEKRLHELNSRPSYLNLFFYVHSFCLGMIAGAVGDHYSLGFLAETEKQVGEHLSGHFDKLPKEDYKSHIILQQMREDEAKHEAKAHQCGAVPLPPLVCHLMQLLSKIMVQTTYWV